MHDAGVGPEVEVRRLSYSEVGILRARLLVIVEVEEEARKKYGDRGIMTSSLTLRSCDQHTKVSKPQPTRKYQQNMVYCPCCSEDVPRATKVRHLRARGWQNVKNYVETHNFNLTSCVLQKLRKRKQPGGELDSDTDDTAEEPPSKFPREGVSLQSPLYNTDFKLRQLLQNRLFITNPHLRSLTPTWP
jgi:hypothetical protein